MCRCTPSIRTPFCGKLGCEMPGQKPDDTRTRLKAQRDAETDPIRREAYALAERAGFDWYDTESSARRAFEHAAGEIVELRTALEQIRSLRSSAFKSYREDCEEMRRIASTAIKVQP